MTWNIRRAALDDAASIAACFRRSYTPNYPYALFNEDVVCSNLQNPDVAMWVVETGGAVRGTAAVVFDKERRKAELGRACIDPDYRGIKENGRSQFQDLITERVQYALDEGAAILHSTAVTSHPKSQVGLQKGGFIPACFEYGKYADLYGTQRETTIEMIYRDSPLLVYRRELSQNVDSISNHALITVAPGNQSVLSKMTGAFRRAHRETATKITDLLSLPFAAGKDHQPDGSELSQNVDLISNHALITVVPGNQSMQDAVSPMTDALSQIIDAQDKFDYVQVKTAADYPHIALLYDALKFNNFRLAGFLPGWSEDHDFIVMQSLRTQLNRDKIYLTSQSRNFVDIVKGLGNI